MEISKGHISRNSRAEFLNTLERAMAASVGIIHVRSEEIIRAAEAIREFMVTAGNDYAEWEITKGFCKYKIEDIYNPLVKGDGMLSFPEAFFKPLREIKELNINQPKQVNVYLFIYPERYLENNSFTDTLILKYLNILPFSDTHVILLTQDNPLPKSIPASLVTVSFDKPSVSELKESIVALLSPAAEHFKDGVPVNDDELNKICYVGAGMSKINFETYAALSVIKAREEKQTKLTTEALIEGVSIGKTEVIKQSDLLQLYPSESIKNVGGLDNLKEWVQKRALCYSDSAKKFGIDPPKGIVLVGVAGNGKSTIAKAISSVLGLPLIKLDFGSMFGSLLGESEGRIRKALKMVQEMSPCCLLIDEIDKGLGGMGGGGDNGTSTRVLGTFLSWLQDNTYPVFTAVTANNITGLPPELLRRGRFDAIFSVGLPNANERKEVLTIHLRKRKHDINAFDAKDIQEVINASEGYVPAEIESAVKDGLINAFYAKEKLEPKHITQALKEMVPLSHSYAEQIATMERWGKENAISASREVVTKAPPIIRKNLSRIKR